MRAREAAVRSKYNGGIRRAAGVVAGAYEVRRVVYLEVDDGSARDRLGLRAARRIAVAGEFEGGAAGLGRQAVSGSQEASGRRASRAAARTNGVPFGLGLERGVAVRTAVRGTPCGKGMSTFVHVVIGDFALFILGRPRHLDEDIRIPLRPPRTDHRGERAVISAPRRHEGSQRQTQSLFQATGVAGIAKDQHGFHRAMTTRARTHSRPDVWTARAQGRHAVAAQHGQRWGHCGRGRDRPRCGTSCGRGHAYKPRSIAWYTG
ncbi:hypothetical protein ACCO45_013604 [Purpureocillium lilacinum]|uniref:Uncharacterized protein n=1 Tax=Purpureocillium lilacinum TaxID=33203 RepID=A0ACC4D7V5_PURLI